jgi:hypothetical protein
MSLTSYRAAPPRVTKPDRPDFAGIAEFASKRIPRLFFTAHSSKTFGRHYLIRLTAGCSTPRHQTICCYARQNRQKGARV